MSAATDAIDRLIEQFIRGDLPFMDFWKGFMALYQDSALTESESARYERGYDIVYMGGGRDVAPEDEAAGVLPDDHVKAQLKAFREAL